MILPPLPPEPQPSPFTDGDIEGARAARREQSRRDAIEASHENVTLTLEELAALVSSGVLTGISIERDRAPGDDPDEHEMDKISRAVDRFVDRDRLDLVPTIQSITESFRERNDRATEWIAYVRLSLVKRRR